MFSVCFDLSPQLTNEPQSLKSHISENLPERALCDDGFLIVAPPVATSANDSNFETGNFIVPCWFHLFLVNMCDPILD